MHQLVIAGQRSVPIGLRGTFPILFPTETCPNDWFVSNTACVSRVFFFLVSPSYVNTVLAHAREEKKCSNFSGEGCTSKCDWPLLCSGCEGGKEKGGKRLYRVKTETRAAGVLQPSQPVGPSKGKFKRKGDWWQVAMCNHQGVTSMSVMHQPVAAGWVGGGMQLFSDVRWRR